jgi:hypothetical protein
MKKTDKIRIIQSVLFVLLIGVVIYMVSVSNDSPIVPVPVVNDTPNELFSTSFDSGSLGSWVEVSPLNYDLMFREDVPGCSNNQGAYDQCTSWMMFRYRGVKGSNVTFTFKNFIYASGSYWNGANARAYVSCNVNDQNSWVPIGTKSLLANPGTTVTKSVKLSMTLPCDNPYFASFIPYQVSFRDKVVNELKSNKNVDVDIIGTSRLNQNIYRLTITNPSVSDANKKIIVVDSGLHSSETYGDFIVEGMVRAAMKDDEWLKKYIIYWYPVSNPVGRFKGYGRYDDLGNDPNRVWSNDKNPEVKIVKYDIIKIVDANRIVLGVDSHGNGGTSSTSYAMTCASTAYAANLKSLSVFKDITGGRCPTVSAPNPSAVGNTGASFYNAYFPKAVGYTSEHVQYPANSYNNLMVQGDGWFKAIKTTWN